MIRMMEKFWLIIASITTILTIIIGFIDGFHRVKMFALLTGLAWAVYLIRRGSRKRMDRYDAEQMIKKNKK